MGARLKELRKTAGLTQSEVANAIGVGGSTIRMMELDKRNGSIDVVTKLANYFKVSVDYLVGNTPFKNSNEVAAKIIEELYNNNLIGNDKVISQEMLDIIESVALNKKH